MSSDCCSIGVLFFLSCADLFMCAVLTWWIRMLSSTLAGNSFLHMSHFIVFFGCRFVILDNEDVRGRDPLPLLGFPRPAPTPALRPRVIRLSLSFSFSCSVMLTFLQMSFTFASTNSVSLNKSPVRPAGTPAGFSSF